MHYRVQHGNSPASIARQFGVSVPSLLAANPHKPTGVVAGRRTWQSLGVGEVVDVPYGLGAAGDPDISTLLSGDQSAWVLGTLIALNTRIAATTGTSCPTWAPPIPGNTTAAVGCFQAYYNANYTYPSAPQSAQLNVRGVVGTPLRTDGALDEDTLCALIAVAALDATTFPTAFPDPSGQFCQPASAPPPATVSPLATLPPDILSALTAASSSSPSSAAQALIALAQTRPGGLPGIISALQPLAANPAMGAAGQAAVAQVVATLQTAANLPATPPAPAPAAPAVAPAANTTPAVAAKPGLSTGEMVGIGVAGAAVLGGIVYAATRGGGRGRRRRR